VTAGSTGGLPAKVADLTRAGYVYHSVETTEDYFRRKLQLSWRAYTLYRLARFHEYPLRQRLRVLRVGADRDNRYKEQVFAYKYDVLERYYRDFLSTEGMVASTSTKATREEIRCLFSVLSEVLVKDYYRTAALVMSDDRVVDVGANVGVYVTAVKELFPSTQVLAFEPARETFATLEVNVGSYAGVRLVNAALGNATATKSLEVGHNNLMNTISDAPESDMKTDPVRRESVAMVRLDEYTDFGGDVIKLDIEGYEERALTGAKGFINENQPLIVCAYEHAKGQKRQLVVTMQSIAPTYQSMTLNETTMCFFLADRHHERIARLDPALT